MFAINDLTLRSATSTVIKTTIIKNNNYYYMINNVNKHKNEHTMT